MTKEQEALKLALEALEEYHYGEARIILRQALEQPEERNFCPRCGKRLGDMRITDAQWSNIHTCTPPDATGSEGFYGLPHGLEKRQTSGGNGVTAGETAPTKDPTQKVARPAGQ
jgi:hypothetical protein